MIKKASHIFLHTCCGLFEIFQKLMPENVKRTLELLANFRLLLEVLAKVDLIFFTGDEINQKLSMCAK